MRAYRKEEPLEKRTRTESVVVLAESQPEAELHRERDAVVIRLRVRQVCRQRTVESRGARTTTGTRADTAILALEAGCAGVGVAAMAVAAASGRVCFGYGCSGSEENFFIAAAGFSLAASCGVAAVIDAMAGDERADDVWVESSSQPTFRACDLPVAHAKVELVLGMDARFTTTTSERWEARIELTPAEWQAVGPSPTFTLMVDGRVVRSGQLPLSPTSR